MVATKAQGQLELQPSVSLEDEIVPFDGPCALEDDEFPFEAISDIAEAESWRKEINRPIYHVHKWWAQRLGTVFRSILLGALSPSGTNILDAFLPPGASQRRYCVRSLYGEAAQRLAKH